MAKVLIIDDSIRDADRASIHLSKDGAEVEICHTGNVADQILAARGNEFAAVLVVWELPGIPTAFDLLSNCRQRWPELPVVVLSGVLDVSLAARAHTLGAKDFLEKPLDSERLRSCLKMLLAERSPESPLLEQLQKRLLGESLTWMATLREVVRVIPHGDSRVLLIGESGTGKELLAQAIHKLGPRANKPWVAVNVAEIPATLIESALFGHERGSFTGATDRRIGCLEESGEGTLFLDEIGDLALELQVKLLRVIQEKKFRRIGGKDNLNFNGRLLAATNRDLAAAVNKGEFRRDLYHRLAEVTIPLPPVRERKGDIDLLLRHFLERNSAERPLRLARETLTILRGYPFHGNVRELENLIKAAVIACEEDVILPRHLPLKSMSALLNSSVEASIQPVVESFAIQDGEGDALQREIAQSLPDRWLEMPYREAVQFVVQAFDRHYLAQKLARRRHNVTQAAKDAGIDIKAFRRRWKDAGLSPLSAEGDGDE